MKPDQAIQLGRQPDRIDRMSGLTGVGWDACWASRVRGELDGIRVEFIGRDAYIRNKRAAGRPQDIVGAARLRDLQSR
jgi:hypothetical protein